MKSSLQLRIGQSLTMTPQLQQAIRLLQLSSIELQAEIREALESNMMLEADEGETLGACDRAYIVNAGRILAEGTPAEILQNDQVRDIYLGERFTL